MESGKEKGKSGKGEVERKKGKVERGKWEVKRKKGKVGSGKWKGEGENEAIGRRAKGRLQSVMKGFVESQGLCLIECR